MAIRSIVEGSPQFFTDLRPADVPPGLPHGVRHLSRGDQFGLHVDGLVGTIGLLNGDTLRIEPKIGEVNFLYMLFRAEGDSSETRQRYESFADYAVGDDAQLSSIAGRQLLIQADRILRRGPLIQRRRVNRRQGSFGGRVDALRTARHLEQRSPTPIATAVTVRSSNTPENRLISEALRRCTGLLPNETDRKRAISIMRRWERRLTVADDTVRDLRFVERRLAARFYAGPRSYYVEALVLARILLGSLGMSLVGAATVRGDSLLLNAADVFERYVRRVVSDHYSPLGFMVGKTGPVQQGLYVDGSHLLNPDVVVSKRDRIRMILDAKYKDPTSSDHYQALAYLRAFGCDTAYLICPTSTSEGLSTREFVTPDNHRVVEARLPMHDFAAAENFLRGLL